MHLNAAALDPIIPLQALQLDYPMGNALQLQIAAAFRGTVIEQKHSAIAARKNAA